MAEVVVDERWKLASGQWTRDAETGSWRLETTPNGRHVRFQGFEADIARMLNAPRNDDALEGFLPPEFSHSPNTGRRLIRPTLEAVTPWVPPYGSTPTDPSKKPTREVRGLRQTTVSIAPQAELGKPLSATEDAPYDLPVPQPGEYEFLSGRFHTEREVLIALEINSGDFFVWFPHVCQWQRIDHVAGGTLATITGTGAEWGIEAIERGAVTEIIIPTVNGMAVVDLDAISLTFDVAYQGKGSAIGAPVMWAGDVRMPVREASGQVCMVSGVAQSIPLPVPAGVRFAPPVCDGRQLIWCAVEGQLIIRKSPDGSPRAQWIDWPQHVSVRFEFGCPFLSRDGSFWQLAFDDEAGQYLYLQLGRQDEERHLLDMPRFCTGAISFRQTERIKGNPWTEAGHANDVGSDEIVVPVLESTRNAAVLSLSIRTTQGFGILESGSERLLAILQYQADNSADQPFFTPQVSEPWRLRVFVHDARLWIYHPEQERIHGWRVAS